MIEARQILIDNGWPAPDQAIAFRFEATAYGELCVSAPGSESALWSGGNRGQLFGEGIAALPNWECGFIHALAERHADYAKDYGDRDFIVFLLWEFRHVETVYNAFFGFLEGADFPIRLSEQRFYAAQESLDGGAYMKTYPSVFGEVVETDREKTVFKVYRKHPDGIIFSEGRKGTITAYGGEISQAPLRVAPPQWQPWRGNLTEAREHNISIYAPWLRRSRLIKNNQAIQEYLVIADQETEHLGLDIGDQYVVTVHLEGSNRTDYRASRDSNPGWLLFGG